MNHTGAHKINHCLGQIASTHSISAGLDYPGIGPELAQLYDSKRIKFTSATDKEALKAYQLLAKTEGIFPALESAYAVAEVIKRATNIPLAVGFGISQPEHIKALVGFADVVVVGSAVIKKIEQKSVQGVKSYVESLVQAGRQ